MVDGEVLDGHMGGDEVHGDAQGTRPQHTTGHDADGVHGASILHLVGSGSVGPMDDATTRDLRRYAEDELGVRMGVAPAVAPPHLDAYRQWLAQGKHGAMAYLADSLELRSHPERLLPEARSVVAIAVDYNRANPHRQGEARIARYALGRDYHKVLRGKLKALARWLDARAPGHTHRPCVDSAPILERDFAQLAGLGWFGKNTMLIDSRRGSWFFIGLLLTTLELEPSVPAMGGCGTCRACVDACPTGAIVHEDGRWQVDARRCVSYLTIEHRGPIPDDLAQGVGKWTFGCDVCQEVCPFNAPRDTQPLRGVPTGESEFLLEAPYLPLSTIASWTEADWDDATRGRALRRAKRAQWKRNAEINLRNGS